jgi:hypothetical protein
VLYVPFGGVLDGLGGPYGPPVGQRTRIRTDRTTELVAAVSGQSRPVIVFDPRQLIGASHASLDMRCGNFGQRASNSSTRRVVDTAEAIKVDTEDGDTIELRQ